MKNHCVLMKFDTPEDAFRYMGGIFHTEDHGDFGIFDDDSFPDYIVFNAVNYIGDYLRGSISDKKLHLALATDIDDTMTSDLLGSPFLLYSKKLAAYYGFHFDSDLMDVLDEDFAQYYMELIAAYDFTALVKSATNMIKSDINYRKNPKTINALLAKISPTIREL